MLEFYSKFGRRLLTDIFERLPIGRGLRFRIARRRMRRSQENISRSYDADIKKAHSEGKKWDDIDSIESQVYFEWSMAEEEIGKVETRYYLSCARDMSVQTDIKSDDWVENKQLGGTSLSVQAISRIRQNIRKEKMEARQEWLTFVPFLSFIAALIAAVTGVITVLKDKPPSPPIILQSPPTPPHPG